MMAWVQVSHSPQDTEVAGADLARQLHAGQVVLLAGDLGAGKTTFVRGACRALGVDAQVRSPTFTIGHLYTAPIPVAHIDLYRIPDLRAEDPDMLAEYVRADTIGFVEWPPQDADAGPIAPGAEVVARVRIEHAGGDERNIAIELEAAGSSP